MLPFNKKFRNFQDGGNWCGKFSESFAEKKSKLVAHFPFLKKIPLYEIPCVEWKSIFGNFQNTGFPANCCM